MVQYYELEDVVYRVTGRGRVEVWNAHDGAWEMHLKPDLVKLETFASRLPGPPKHLPKD